MIKKNFWSSLLLWTPRSLPCGGAQDEESQMAAITAHASELAELAVEEDEILRRCGPLTAEDRVFGTPPGAPHIDERPSMLCSPISLSSAAIVSAGRTAPSWAASPASTDACDRHRPPQRFHAGREHGLQLRYAGDRRAIARPSVSWKQAERFGRPIITFIDTPGAYPGKEAEERGQGEAIARNLMEMSGLTVPVIAVVTGEGSSGGALALGVANHILMLENAVYSVLSP